MKKYFQCVGSSSYNNFFFSVFVLFTASIRSSHHSVFHQIHCTIWAFHPTLCHFTTIASLLWGTASWMAPCYIIMIFLHNAAKRAHSTQTTFCKPQQGCQSGPTAQNIGSLKSSFLKLLRCTASSTFSTAPLTWKMAEESVQCLSYIDRERRKVGHDWWVQ